MWFWQKYFWTVLAFLVVLGLAKSSIYNREDLAFHCDDFRFSVGSLFRKEGFTLRGHVQKSTNASSLLQCGQLCLSHAKWCVSINFELNPNIEDVLNTCELNNFGVESEQEISVGGEFEKRDGFVYNQIRPYKVKLPLK